MKEQAILLKVKLVFCVKENYFNTTFNHTAFTALNDIRFYIDIAAENLTSIPTISGKSVNGAMI